MEKEEAGGGRERRTDGAEGREGELALEGLYRTERSSVFRAAYRMLGSVADAEDVTQELFADLHAGGLPELRSSRAYLVRAAVNRSLKLLGSARRRRERYAGEWLPEPLPDPDGPELPEQAAEQRERLTYGFMTLLEQLTPTERAVLVLHEAYGYAYEEIAIMLGKTPAACRQHGSRAKRKLSRARGEKEEAAADRKESRAGRAAVSMKPQEEDEADAARGGAAREQLIARFVEAFERARVEELRELLSDDAVLVTDGGGKVRAAMRPIVGKERVLSFLASPKILHSARAALKRLVRLNGEPQLLLLAKPGEAESILCLEADASGTRIRKLYLIRNPDKLAHVKA
ncbi:sigma-70 family RNA polymerase sigma factor [Paenibacillus albicereus]|uniref:Sigma-70 family RNA polymerase sigma factor n=1 Tax=Paenibacillus albicereus TaxID=2726185 RepID=A0A6H2H375_9BACL|nr:sigma-70 family RNA polymerase sigma factor [Paenibacillus albicereus]QJC53788.1 sigma-70 family RNA polymerase sigma factor [Paenibacillus albicereus]